MLPVGRRPVVAGNYSNYPLATCCLHSVAGHGGPAYAVGWNCCLHPTWVSLSSSSSSSAYQLAAVSASSHQRQLQNFGYYLGSSWCIGFVVVDVYLLPAKWSNYIHCCCYCHCWTLDRDYYYYYKSCWRMTKMMMMMWM